MKVKMLKNDGRCRWLDKIFLQQLIPMMQEAKRTGEKRSVLLRIGLVMTRDTLELIWTGWRL